MFLGSCVDPLDPQGAHVSLLRLAVSVCILKRLLHTLSSHPDAILAPASEALCKAEHLCDGRQSESSRLVSLHSRLMCIGEV